ncbi:YopX family protein [Streptococcus suis]|uniref:YopX family protein n=1 Tax=Streptococcus suis TaxID=1307 RepID=UPI0009423F6B|nr:YopX family protein [Streptococcus suis]MDN2998951.1 YopX family protein [Streptococcus suis]MDW8657399.1 YopX family protein [Streptococcus suis]MDW8663267.1 YopX family protein [Streptococcus suis]MDW8697298.1 YopX family protein [Streptococcus suis]MDW8727939.1 YopX family protein [Streptococcus suis]
MIPKFRAWHKGMMRMSEVLAISYERQKVKIKHQRGTTHMTVPLDDVVLMQSTGLVDVNGKEIFEGDVVRVTCEHPIDFPDCQGVVRMLEGRYMVCDDKTERGSELFSEIFSNEIIGNIYENPELVEVLND